MLSFIVCSFLIFYILYKKKKSFYTLPCCGQQAMGLLSTFYCASLRFFCRICFFYQGKNKIHRQTSLLDIDWNIYLAHAFASKMYTNWLISNQKQSSTLYTWSAFVPQSVCAGAFGFIVVVNSFIVGLFLFYFWKPVTICHSLKSAHVMVLLWIWRAVWKDRQAFEDCIIKPDWFFFLFFNFFSQFLLSNVSHDTQSSRNLAGRLNSASLRLKRGVRLRLRTGFLPASLFF